MGKVSQFSNILCDLGATISSQNHIKAKNQHQLSASTIRQKQQKSAKSVNQHTPVIPGQPEISRQPLSAANQPQLLVCTTRQQYQISISFQPLPPASSTKSASASSFHHQAAAPNQHQLPASTTRQQHQIRTSLQLPPPDSSTTSASPQQGNQPTSC